MAPYGQSEEQQKKWTYALLNDEFSPAKTDKPEAARSFHPFPRLPIELRLRIWESLFPQTRFVSVTLTEPLEARHPEGLFDLWAAGGPLYSRRNHLGNVVSGCPYKVDVAPYSQWSRDTLRYVNRETNQVYRDFYRLALPFPRVPTRRGHSRHSSRSSFGNANDEDGEDEDMQFISRVLGSLGQRTQPTEETRILRLNPDTDIVDLSVECQLHSIPGQTSELGNRLNAMEILIAFLYDAWAHDPRGVGISKLMLGRGLHDSAMQLIQPYFDCSYFGGDRDAQTVVRGKGKAAVYPEAMYGLRKYFSGFANTETHAFYSAIRIPVRYSGRHPIRGRIPGAVGDVDDMVEQWGDGRGRLRRATPLMPYPVRVGPYAGLGVDPAAAGGRKRDASSAVAAILDLDPRPFVGKDTASNLVLRRPLISSANDGAVQLPPQQLWRQDPRWNVMHWCRLLETVADIPREKTLQGVRYLAAQWPAMEKGRVPHTAGLTGAKTAVSISHREQVLAMFRRLDADRLGDLSQAGEDWLDLIINTSDVFWQEEDEAHYRHAMQGAWEFQGLLEKPNPDVPEVAGAWVFGSDALGDVFPPPPRTDGTGDENGGEDEGDGINAEDPDENQFRRRLGKLEIDMTAHRPGLMVLDLDG